MSMITLSVKKRQTGKSFARKYRREDLVPGVLYGKGIETIPVLARPLDLRDIIYTSETKIIKLDIEGQPFSKNCILKDVTFDPVTDRITHFDLFGISEDTKISVEVPVVLTGQAVGVKKGGNLQQNVRKILVHCYPANIPTAITVDISNLDIGKSLLIKDIDFKDMEHSLHKETVVATIIAPRVSAKEKQQQAKS